MFVCYTAAFRKTNYKNKNNKKQIIIKNLFFVSLINFLFKNLEKRMPKYKISVEATHSTLDMTLEDGKAVNKYSFLKGVQELLGETYRFYRLEDGSKISITIVKGSHSDQDIKGKLEEIQKFLERMLSQKGSYATATSSSSHIHTEPHCFFRIVDPSSIQPPQLPATTISSSNSVDERKVDAPVVRKIPDRSIDVKVSYNPYVPNFISVEIKNVAELNKQEFDSIYNKITEMLVKVFNNKKVEENNSSCKKLTCKMRRMYSDVQLITLATMLSKLPEVVYTEAPILKSTEVSTSTKKIEPPASQDRMRLFDPNKAFRLIIPTIEFKVAHSQQPPAPATIPSANIAIGR